MKADSEMTGEPLRDATPRERTQALSLAGLSSAPYVWVLGAADDSRTFIVCPDVAVNGVAVAVDTEGRELWRKPAFYSELLRAGDGYELRRVVASNSARFVGRDVDRVGAASGCQIPQVGHAYFR